MNPIATLDKRLLNTIGSLVYSGTDVLRSDDRVQPQAELAAVRQQLKLVGPPAAAGPSCPQVRKTPTCRPGSRATFCL